MGFKKKEVFEILEYIQTNMSPQWDGSFKHAEQMLKLINKKIITSYTKNVYLDL